VIAEQILLRLMSSHHGTLKTYQLGSLFNLFAKSRFGQHALWILDLFFPRVKIFSGFAAC